MDDRINRINKDVKSMVLQMSKDTKDSINLIKRKTWQTIWAIIISGLIILTGMIVGFSYMIKNQNNLIKATDRAITEIRQIAIDIREKAGVQQK